MSNYGWATHQPLIKAVLQSYKIKFILELGAGFDSTPIFLESKVKFLSIENDFEWVKAILKKYPEANIQYHDCRLRQGVIYNKTYQYQKDIIAEYYNRLDIPIPKPKLLFVDNFAACRLIALNTLGHKFDFIIYHDSHCRGYAYHKINLTGYKKFELFTELSNAVLLVKDGINTDLLLPEFDRQIKEFQLKNPDCKKIWVK